MDTLARLRRLLGDGTFAAGDRLPAERDLAARLGAGRSTLRKALDQLEAEGRLRREVGRGTFVAPDTLSATLHLDPLPGPGDVLELRQMIEPEIAALAALRAAPEAVVEMRRLCDAAERAPDWAAWEAQDSALHSSIGRAARNPLLLGVLDTLNDIRNQKAWRDLRRETLDASRQHRFSRQHRQVIDSIEAGDAARARTAMRTHLKEVRRAMTHLTQRGGDHAP